jgi:hypothetical protein
MLAGPSRSIVAEIHRAYHIFDAPLSMISNAPDSTISSTALRRRWWQFSLLNLLLVAVIVCVTAAYYGTRKELEQSKRELALQQNESKSLRDQLGILDVGDESKIYLQARPSDYNSDQFHWRWRIHLPKLPPGTNWSFANRIGRVESQGFETRGGGGGGGSTRLEGQFDLDIHVERYLDGSAWLSLTAKGNGHGFDSDHRLSEEEVQSLRRLASRGGIQIAGRKLIVATADQPLELVRISSNDKPGEQIGLLIFLKQDDRRDKSTSKQIEQRSED